MSFTTDIQSPNLNKIVICEIDLPIINTVWLNDQSGIWAFRFIQEEITQLDDAGNTMIWPKNVEEVPNRIGTCLVDDNFLNKVLTHDLVDSTNESFYYDRDNADFYIHLDDWEPPLDQIIRIGVVNLFAQRNDTSAYLSDIYVDPRIKTISSLSQTKDPLFFGIQPTPSGSVGLLNQDGHFDDYDEKNPYGQPSRFKIGFDGYTYDELEQVFEGFIEDDPYDFNVFSIKVRDKRKNFSKKIPFRQFSQDEFGDLNEDDEGKWKPVNLGNVFYEPVVCLNKDESSPTDSKRHFMFLDTEFGSADPLNVKNTTAIAYIKNDEDNNIFDSVTIQDIDLDTGIFTILTSDVDNDDGEPRDVFFSGYGYEDTLDALDAFIFVIDTFSDIAYNDTFFNTTEINAELVDNVDISYWLKRPKDLLYILGQILYANDSYLYTQNDGRLSAKKFDPDRVSTDTIQNYRWISKEGPKFSWSSFLTSVTIENKKHNARNNYLNTVVNNTYERDGLDQYKKYETKEFKVVSSTLADAETKAENIMLQTKDRVRVVTRTGDMSLYNIDIMDIITTSHTRESEAENLQEWEVIGKTFDLTNFQIILTMKYWGEI